MKRIVLLVLCTVFLCGFSFAQADLQPAAIVSLTRSEPITVKQFRTEVEQAEKTTRRVLTQDEKKQILDLMINERLVLQAAARDQATVSDNDINQQISDLKKQMVAVIGREPTDSEFAIALRNETGLELSAYRDQIRKQLILQKYLMQTKRGLFETIAIPTDAEILSTYNLERTQFVRPETVRFSMIQVSFGADKIKAKELADRLKNEIGNNTSKFDEVVLRGQSPNSGYQAGDGGYLPRIRDAAQVVGQEFIDTAFTLKQGEVSKVMEGRLGYQIIKITETYSMKNLELTDTFQLGVTGTVRDYIGTVLLQEQQKKVLAQATEELVADLRKSGKITINEKNLNW